MEALGTPAASGPFLCGPARGKCGSTRLPFAGLLRWRRRGATVLVALALGATLKPSAGALDVNRLQQSAVALGPRAERAATELRELVVDIGRIADTDRLERVNRFVNRRVNFASDAEVWKENDYWASPLETLGKGEGDCEDYAITKFFTLLAGGMPASKLRLVYVRAQLPASPGQPGGPQAHMVLAYYADNATEPLILDNLMPEIKPASSRPDLTPIFSFNSEGLWNGAGPQTVGDPQARLSRWRDLMRKARAEGF